MTLHDFLKVCSSEDFVGIYNLDSGWSTNMSAKRFETIPTQQRYMKIKNIPYGRIRYFLDKEVARVAHNEKGYYIQIYTAGAVKARLEQRELARLIGEQLKR